MLLRRDPRLRWLALLALLTWLPTSFVYISERYLYLPSVAFVGAIALCLTRVPRRALWLAAGLCGIWIGVQAHTLRAKHDFFALDRTQVGLAQHLREVDHQLEGARARTLLLLNFPGDWIDAQFAREAARVQLDDPGRELQVLTLMPPLDRQETYAEGLLWRPSQLRRESPHTLRVTSSGSLVDGAGRLFPSVRFEPGVRVAGPRLGFEVEVLGGRGGRANDLRFHFPQPLEDYALVWFEPPPPSPDWFDTPGGVISACRVSILELPRP